MTGVQQGSHEVVQRYRKSGPVTALVSVCLPAVLLLAPWAAWGDAWWFLTPLLLPLGLVVLFFVELPLCAASASLNIANLRRSDRSAKDVWMWVGLASSGPLAACISTAIVVVFTLGLFGTPK